MTKKNLTRWMKKGYKTEQEGTRQQIYTNQDLINQIKAKGEKVQIQEATEEEAKIQEKGDHCFSEMVLPPIDKKFMKEVVSPEKRETVNHDFTKYSIYDTDGDNRDLILIDNKNQHFDRRGKQRKVSTTDENNSQSPIQLATVNSTSQDGTQPNEEPEEFETTGAKVQFDSDPICQTKKCVQKHHVKKNYIDPTAGFQYLLGCSIVHFSLLTTMCFIYWPDIQKVGKGPEKEACLQESVKAHNMLKYLCYFHTYAMINTFYRENFESGIGNVAQIMRFLETMGSMVYVGLMIKSIQIYFQYYLWTNNVFVASSDIAACIDKQHVRGRVKEWLTIEILVYLYYLITMLILMIKSRFILIGIDQSRQFESFYLSKMANIIIDCIPFDKNDKKTIIHKMCKKQNHVEVLGVEMHTQFNPEDIEAYYDVWYLKKSDYVSQKDSQEWFETKLCGKITMNDLDFQRTCEINSCDVMQNTSIVYHLESLLEMQFLCLLSLATVQSYLNKTSDQGSYNKDGSLRLEIGSVTILAIEHVLSYISGYYRKWEILNYGVMDVNGTYRAPKETIISMFEILIDAIILGFLMNHLVSMSQEEFHSQPLVHYWVITDCIIMFFTIGYVYMVQSMKTKNELNKNIFSLHFKQRQKMHEAKQFQDKELDRIKQLVIEEEFGNIIGDQCSSNHSESAAVPVHEEQISVAQEIQNKMKLNLKGVFKETKKRVNINNNLKLRIKESVDIKNLPEKDIKEIYLDKMEIQSRLNNHIGAKMVNTQEKTKTEALSKLHLSRQSIGDLESSDEEQAKSSDSSDEERMFMEQFKFLNVSKSMSFMKSQFEKDREDKIETLNQSEIAKKLHRDSVIKEVDYLNDESIQVEMDVYDLFIAANITKNVSPQQLNYCLEKCIYVFLIQILSCLGFVWDYSAFDDFQPFSTFHTALRFIASVLFHQQIHSELQQSVKMLSFLKRMKTCHQNLKGRYINIMIASMHFITCIIALVCLIITISQENNMQSITKDYVTIAFILNIDNMFAGMLPEQVKVNANRCNSLNLLKMGKDSNSYKLIYQRLKAIDTDENDKWFTCYLREAANIMVNIWCGFLLNFEIIIFNYFGPFMSVIIQFIGYYSQVEKQIAMVKAGGF